MIKTGIQTHNQAHRAESGYYESTKTEIQKLKSCGTRQNTVKDSCHLAKDKYEEDMNMTIIEETKRNPCSYENKVCN